MQGRKLPKLYIGICKNSDHISHSFPCDFLPMLHDRILLKFGSLVNRLEDLLKAFESADTDVSGLINREEAIALMDKLPNKLSTNERRRIFDHADIDTSGGLDKREVIKLQSIAYYNSILPCPLSSLLLCYLVCDIDSVYHYLSLAIIMPFMHHLDAQGLKHLSASILHSFGLYGSTFNGFAHIFVSGC
jgi:hypothetical protein